MFKSTTYSILISPEYSRLRYALLCVVLLTFAYSETSYNYPNTETTAFVILVINSFLCKIIPTIILITALPLLLFKQRYATFWISMLIVIFASVLIQQVALESIICKYFGIYFWKENANSFYLFIDTLAKSALAFMVVLGVFMGRIFKYWNKENEQKQHILSSSLQMESETMKERISPTLLCETLHKSGESAIVAPEETSDILMRLSRLLRYQLYDCRQEKVLLESDIKFLSNYLSILQYNGGCSDFNISVSGKTIGILIPPLLFIPFLQTAKTSDNHSEIDIKIGVVGNLLTFDLTDNHKERNDANVRRRLEQLYPQRYNLTIEPKYISLKIQFQ